MRGGLRVAAVVAVLAIVLGSQTARAGPVVRALLVGVGHYASPQFGDLPGARNDAVLAAEVLTRPARGGVRIARPADVALLVDDPRRADTVPVVPVRGAPTRDAILAALDALARDARAGDQVLVLFSGHGVQQPERSSGSEPDGLDEAFVPVDAGEKDAQARYPGVLIDDEIGARFDAIRAKGADVFFIADFCHSGDSTRGGARATNKVASGFRAHPPPPSQRSGAAAPGALVAFFAARSDRLAGQRKMPYFEPPERQRFHGLLTYYTLEALRQPGIRTYAELFNQVDSLIKTHTGDPSQRDAGDANPPQPQGDLTRPVLGRAADARAPDWEIEKPPSESERMDLSAGITLAAGALDGLVPGALLELVPAERSLRRGSIPILYARVKSVEPWSARLEPADAPRRDARCANRVTAAAWSDLRDCKGEPFTQQAYYIARVVDRPVVTDLAVSLPGPAGLADRRLAAVAAMLRSIDLAALNARLAPSPGQANVVLSFATDTSGGTVLSFLTSAKPGAHAFGMAALDTPADGLKRAVTDALARAARYRRIQAVMRDLGAQATSDTSPARDLKVEFFTRASLVQPDRSCRGDRVPPERLEQDAVPLTNLAPGREFRRCDQLYLRVTNLGRSPVYVAPVMLSPEGSIRVLSVADARYEIEPCAPNARCAQLVTLGYRMSTPASVEGAEDDLNLIVLRIDPGSPNRPSFTALEQPPIICPDAAHCQQPSRGRGLDDQSPAMQELMWLLSEGSRSGPGALPGNVGLLHYSWVTVPD